MHRHRNFRGDPRQRCEQSRFAAPRRRDGADFQRMEAAIQRLEAATKGDFQRLEAGTTAEFAAVRSEMALIEHRLLTRLGSLIVIDAGLLFAALRYLPPVH